MQKPHIVRYAGISGIIAVIAVAVGVYAQQSFRGQVLERVAELAAKEIISDLVIKEQPTGDLTIGGGGMSPIKVDLFGTNEELANRGMNQGGEATTTIAWFWLQTSTDYTIKEVAVPDNYDRASLFIMAKASTTVAGVDIQVEGSWNGFDWFSFRQATTTGDGLVLTGTTTVKWIPGIANSTATAVFSNALFDDIRAPYYRFTIRRQVGVLDGNGRYQSYIMFFDNQ